MNKFTARLSAKTTKDLDSIRFNDVENGMLILRAPKKIVLGESEKRWITFKIKLELHLGGNESVAQVFLTRKFVEMCESHQIEIDLVKPNIRKPLEGTYDSINLLLKVVSNKNKRVLVVPEGTDICHVRFVSKAYHELQLSKSADGLSSTKVEIDVYVGDNYKPYSNQQMCSHGVEIVADPKGLLAENYKFYELTSKSILENYLDEKGNSKDQEVQCLPTDFNVFNK